MSLTTVMLWHGEAKTCREDELLDLVDARAAALGAVLIRGTYEWRLWRLLTIPAAESLCGFVEELPQRPAGWQWRWQPMFARHVKAGASWGPSGSHPA